MRLTFQPEESWREHHVVLLEDEKEEWDPTLT